mmetsp:Transcript_100696/g.323321  ORF Transcript_100696/g.323321 Transcript_100696/m.323321 type:complete len:731 (+) Transcript_100696:3-2195(+)
MISLLGKTGIPSHSGSSSSLAPQRMGACPSRMGGKRQRGDVSAPPAAGGQVLQVCGPSYVETLRGSLLGREVALICCGEAHEDAIDLTRRGCVIEAEAGWVDVDCADGHGFDPDEALAEQGGLTLQGAKSWAERVLQKAAEDSDDSDDDDNAEGFLVWEATRAKAKGRARVFSSELERSAKFQLEPGAIILERGDLDDEAREFNKRRLRGDRVPQEEHDALIGRRKLDRLAEGVEFLDDWLLRQVGFEEVHTRVILESPIHPDEVELHVDSSAGPAPPAHTCLRHIEVDSDADSEDDDDPDDGTGAYADYFHRRLSAHLPRECVRGVDPRDLGDAGDDEMRGAFQALQKGHPPLPEDAEVVELQLLNAAFAVPDIESDEGTEDTSWKEHRAEKIPPVPSWEGYFSAAAELLYYSPQVKADYAPFLARCVGSRKAAWNFFEALYFRTIPEAIAAINLGTETRPFAQTRSLAYQPPGGGPLFRRLAVQSKIPVRAPPLERCLKARGSNPPRTWISGIADRLQKAGCSELVIAVQKWFRESVEYLLTDPKEADEEGDYFAAWLRACHREIWDDIDKSDPAELRRKEWVASQAHSKNKKKRHQLRDITIPGITEAFNEFSKFDPAKRTSTMRERVLAKIIVDAFQLRLVDISMVFAIADAVLASPSDKPVVILLYAGEDHTKSVADFWRKRGFASSGLPGKGQIGKNDWEDEDPRGLDFPAYLRDVRNLFPVPK